MWNWVTVTVARFQPSGILHELEPISISHRTLAKFKLHQFEGKHGLTYLYQIISFPISQLNIIYYSATPIPFPSMWCDGDCICSFEYKFEMISHCHWMKYSMSTEIEFETII